MSVLKQQARGSTARLRALSRLGTALLASLVLIACVALVVLTTLSRRYERRVTAVNDSLRAIEQLRVDFGNYLRQGSLARITHDPTYAANRMRLEADILEDGATAVRLATDPQQKRALEDVSGDIRNFFLLAAREKDLGAVVTQPLIISASDIIGKLGHISRSGFDAVNDSEHRLDRWSLIENILGVAIAVSLLVGFVLVVAAVRRMVFAPLLALGDGIDRFAAGDMSARVVPTGDPRMQQTAGSFNDMASRLERRKQDLLTFLAGVAHDLRNPLAAMRMGLHYLDPEHSAAFDEKQRTTLQLIGRQVTRLERMVGDFLDASRIEAGHLELRREPADLRELAQEVVQLYASSSVKHRLVCSAPAYPVELRADGERIAQVLNNLVSNAIKYSPNGGDVLVSVAQQGDQGVVSVQDSGIGIPPSDLPHLFEPFRRTGVSRETAPGVGLGLSVAQQIIEAHGGRIEVQSTLGAGSIFRIHLPLGSGPPAFAPAPLH